MATEADERDTDKESVRFFYIAKGPLPELRPQLQIAFEIAHIESDTFKSLDRECRQLGKTIGALIKARNNILASAASHLLLAYFSIVQIIVQLKPMSRKIAKFLKEGLQEKVYPGAVLLVARGEDVLFFQSAGNRALIPGPLAMEKDTIFDLASLTKPLGTTLAIMKLEDEGLLGLDTPISSLIKPFPWEDKTDLTPRLLLNHSAGLQDWKPFYLDLINHPLEQRKSLLRRLIMEEALCETPGKESLYSDLGFMLLEWILELITGRNLSTSLNAHFYHPLGLKDLYLDQIAADPPREKELCAATEYCRWRKEVIQGHVHDENAYALGGYSGHAGLFGTALDIFALTSRLIKIYHGYSSKPLKTETVRTFFSRQEIVPGSTWALGWDTPVEKNSSSGDYFSANSVGHTGFTGTSVWIDLDKSITVIFLTNRIHPHRSNEKIRALRPRLHNLIMREFGYA